MIANSNGGSELLCDFDDLVELFIEWILSLSKTGRTASVCTLALLPVSDSKTFPFLKYKFR